MIDASILLLIEAGLRVDIVDGYKLAVSPSERLTDALRQHIRTHKGEILLALADTNCQRCAHLCRPGASRGYCSIRDDLPPAYGDTHPLRICPADGGDTCNLATFSKPH